MNRITTLIHHIELNEHGWWEKAVTNIIITVIGMSGNVPQKKHEIVDCVSKRLENGVNKFRLIKQFDLLINENRIINVSDDFWILNEREFSSYKIAKKEQDDLEAKVKLRFTNLAMLYSKTLNADLLWGEFNSKMLYPLIKDIGAKTYEFISGKKAINLIELKTFQDFSQRYNEEKGNIEKIIIEFMNFSDKDTNNYLLILLNEYFFIESTNLDERTINGIYQLVKSQKSLNIFVDTNFLLTIFDLQDNPSNEATKALIDLINETSNKIKIKFCILPNTIREFQNLIRKFNEYITKIKPTLAYARAVENLSEFSGILKKYFQKCNELGRVIPAEEYFDPYLSNFTVCYRSKKIELYNKNCESYSTDQRVVDDLISQTDYRLKRKISKEKNGSSLSKDEIEYIKTRIYDKFNHDCQIWHIVKDLRPQYIDSPKDIVNWIITLDFSFLEYDRYKQKIDDTLHIGICLHPNDLISMLQFWVPRTEKFERAILGNMKLPFLFNEVDSEAEKISVNILSSLSQFEGHESYSEELVTQILTNKAIRQKIKPTNSIEQNAELIKGETLKQLNETQKALAKEKETSEDLATELCQVKYQVEKMSSDLAIISQNAIANTEERIKIKQKDNMQEVITQKERLKNKLELIDSKLIDKQRLRERANIELGIKLNSLSSKLGIFFRKKYRQQLEEKIIPQYYDKSEYDQLLLSKNQILNELKSLERSEFQNSTTKSKIIIFCENKNSEILNMIGFKDIAFSPEKNSNGVFLMVRNNPDKFGLRDRDFLLDSEIKKLQKQFNNYFILKYYCFENYLYHPNNIVELRLNDFNVQDYLKEIIRQKNLNKDTIISIYKKSRDTYEEFKIDSEKFKSKDDSEIINHLRSDQIDIFFKVYSMKDYFNKSFIEKYNLNFKILSSTMWFKTQFAQIINFS